MIVFNLKCANGHVFEEWFASGTEYEALRDGHGLTCPTCGGHDVEKAIMAPRVNSGARPEMSCQSTCPHGPSCPHAH